MAQARGDLRKQKTSSYRIVPCLSLYGDATIQRYIRRCTSWKQDFVAVLCYLTYISLIASLLHLRLRNTKALQQTSQQISPNLRKIIASPAQYWPRSSLHHISSPQFACMSFARPRRPFRDFCYVAREAGAATFVGRGKRAQRLQKGSWLVRRVAWPKGGEGALNHCFPCSCVGGTSGML